MATIAPEPQLPPQNDAAETVLSEKVAHLSTTEEPTPAGSSKASETASDQMPSQPVIPNDHPEQIRKPVAIESTTPQEKFSIPIAYPVEASKPSPQPELTAEQKLKYENVLSAVEAWSDIPTTSAKDASKAPLTDDERLWLTRDCILRYLRATKWVVNDTLSRLQTTVTWRREYNVNGLTAEHISVENETGKQVLLGYDLEGRPCLYQDPSKQNTEESERQIQHLVYLLERAIELMPPGQETLALVIDYKNSSRKTTPSMRTSRRVLDILQTYYPERLGRALISELPWYVTAFFKLISPFIDPVTKTKLKFNEPLRNHVPAAQLWSNYGGEAQFTYEHGSYWPALTGLCEQRRIAIRQRWEGRGKKIGDDEWILKGGEITK